MVPLSALLLLVAQTTAANPARPAECAQIDGAHALNVWERAKSPALRRYCDLVASGATKLAGASLMVSDVLAVADEAEHAIPGRGAPLVLRGRALVRLGRFGEAYQALAMARARDERILEDPPALLAWARAALDSGHLDESRTAYRALLPRASSLPAGDRGAAYVEAGLLAMAAGPPGLEEAIAALREGERTAGEIVEPLTVLALALALDRAGDREQARLLVAERVHGDPRGRLSELRARRLVVAGPGTEELDAMAALALEPSAPAVARDTWKAFALASKGPWAEHARAREASLAGKRAAARGGTR